MRLTQVTTSDLPAVLTLLELVDLPVEGVKEHFSHFFVITNDNIIVGSVGVEVYKDSGLLRSLAIHPNYQGKGLGQKMVNHVEQYSVEQNLKTLYLLTETAETFFFKLGYEYIGRDEVDLDVQQSIEFTELCPSAPVMVRLIS